jgi:hypothetical protein
MKKYLIDVIRLLLIYIVILVLIYSLFKLSYGTVIREDGFIIYILSFVITYISIIQLSISDTNEKLDKILSKFEYVVKKTEDEEY